MLESCCINTNDDGGEARGGGGGGGLRGLTRHDIDSVTV